MEIHWKGVINELEQRTTAELNQLQMLPFDIKVKKTQERIREWVEHFGEEGVSVSFSGGKDSTVLLDICRKMYPGLRGHFLDTGLEYPEIRNFVKKFDNIDWIKPKYTFKQVIEKFGYPFLGKEIAECLYYSKKWFDKIIVEDEEFSEFLEGGNIDDIIDSDRIRELILNMKPKDGPRASLAKVFGMRTKDGSYKVRPTKDEAFRRYNYNTYSHALAAPYLFGSLCCDAMKKNPAHRYEHKTGRVPITGQMASESALRATSWLKYGCNAFEAKRPISNPMSFWTEQDVLLYIKKYNIDYCREVYGDIVDENGNNIDLTEFEDNGLFEVDRPLLKTTGANRTGCLFCGFGCHLEKEDDARFVRIKNTHPKQYEYIMKDTEDGGLGYKKVIDWLNNNLGLDIKY